jgi:glycosyl transferase, family 25
MIDIANYVINLEERRDRRIEMEEQLRRIGWMAQFSNSLRPSSADGFPSIGARGCFESHLATLERGRIFRAHVLIMEDDLNFAHGFSELWKRAMADIEATDWSIFYPAHLLPQDDQTRDGLTAAAPDLEIRCTHFVMFHRDAVPKVIDGLKAILSRPPGHPLGGPMHVDGAYATIRQQNPNLKTYVYCPSLGYQRSSRSDIADLRLIDRIETLRPIVSRLRRIKQRLR